MVLEERTGVLRDEPLLLGEADRLAGLVRVLDARLAVGRVGARDGVDALADDGLAHDQLGLAVLGGLGGRQRLFVFRRCG